MRDSGAPLGGALRCRLCKSVDGAADPVILPVYRGARLLAPGLFEASGVDRVEPQIVDELGDDLLALVIRARDRKSDAALGAGRDTLVEEALQKMPLKTDGWRSRDRRPRLLPTPTPRWPRSPMPARRASAVARVGDPDLMSELGEAARAGSVDLACSDDAHLHE